MNFFFRSGVTGAMIGAGCKFQANLATESVQLLPRPHPGFDFEQRVVKSSAFPSRCGVYKLWSRISTSTSGVTDATANSHFDVPQCAGTGAWGEFSTCRAGYSSCLPTNSHSLQDEFLGDKTLLKLFTWVPRLEELVVWTY